MLQPRGNTVTNYWEWLHHKLLTVLQEYYLLHDHLHCGQSHLVQGLHSHTTLNFNSTSKQHHILHIKVFNSMTAWAVSTVFWPGITPAIASISANCGHYNCMASSQSCTPPYPPIPPTYPFQCICADFFNHKRMHYLVDVDQYSNWPITEVAHEGSKGLINFLRWWFATFGIPDECTTDGGPEFQASATCTFLKEWAVHHLTFLCGILTLKLSSRNRVKDRETFHY